MKNQEHGMVLIIVLVLLGICTLLLLHQMEELMKARQSLNLFRIKNNLFEEMERQAYQLVQPVMHSDNGNISTQSGPLAYQIQDLGIYPCLLLGNPKEHFPSHHWDIIVSTLSHRLKIRIATREKTIPSNCTSSYLRYLNTKTVAWTYE